MAHFCRAVPLRIGARHPALGARHVKSRLLCAPAHLGHGRAGGQGPRRQYPGRVWETTMATAPYHLRVGVGTMVVSSVVAARQFHLVGPVLAESRRARRDTPPAGDRGWGPTRVVPPGEPYSAMADHSATTSGIVRRNSVPATSYPSQMHASRPGPSSTVMRTRLSRVSAALCSFPAASVTPRAVPPAC